MGNKKEQKGQEISARQTEIEEKNHTVRSKMRTSEQEQQRTRSQKQGTNPDKQLVQPEQRGNESDEQLSEQRGNESDEQLYQFEQERAEPDEQLVKLEPQPDERHHQPDEPYERQAELYQQQPDLYEQQPELDEQQAQIEEQPFYFRGRGAQINTKNRFHKQETVREHSEGIDDWTESNAATQYIEQEAKSIVNKVESPDVGMMFSMNAYQGCEHGCIYCYARNVHEYWGYSAGLDFEQKIVVKKNAPQLLRKFLMNPKWECHPLSMSGNTDCYQPAEQKFRLTRKLLEVCEEFNQPVGLITKNASILKDRDILTRMAAKGLVSVFLSITSFNEDLRRVMEPRTTTGQQRLRVIKELSQAGVRCGVMLGPMIPGLNEHEMQRIMKAAGESGATFSAYTFVRLNGAVKLLFHDWLYKNFPDRADKVWHMIEQSHDGKVNDSRFGARMRGEGNIAEMVAQQYRKYANLYNLNAERWELDCSQFRRPGQQMSMF